MKHFIENWKVQRALHCLDICFEAHFLHQQYRIIFGWLMFTCFWELFRTSPFCSAEVWQNVFVLEKESIEIETAKFIWIDLKKKLSSTCHISTKPRDRVLGLHRKYRTHKFFSHRKFSSIQCFILNTEDSQDASNVSLRFQVLGIDLNVQAKQAGLLIEHLTCEH